MAKRPYIPFARPTISPDEQSAVLAVLRSGWLTTGKVTAEFEREFGAYVGMPHALALNSATAGLHLGLEALGIGDEDRVIMSPYTFTATAEVARYLGAHPLFVDIEPDSFNIDPDKVESVLAESGERVRCILPIHVGGAPCRLDRLSEISTVFGIPMVEDAAHALPCRTPWGAAGTVGDIGVYSFYANKTITTGEGGMLVTRNDEIAHRVSVLRLHGIDRPVWDRYSADRPADWEYDVVAPGYKYNLTDIAAAIGRGQLAKADLFHARRAEIARRYLAAFGKYDFLRMPPSPEANSWHLFILRVDENRLSITRDQFIEKFMEEGIGASVHYKPLHLMQYYRQTYGLRPDDFPNSLRAYQSALSIPVYPALSDDDVSRVIEAVVRIGTLHYRAGIHARL